jgi:hypothetical protein
MNFPPSFLFLQNHLGRRLITPSATLEVDHILIVNFFVDFQLYDFAVDKTIIPQA